MGQKYAEGKPRSPKTIVRLTPAANDNFPQEEIVKRLEQQEEEARTLGHVQRSNGQLWESLSDLERRAAHLIYIGFLAKFAELGVRTQRFLWMPKGRHQVDDYRDHLIDLFTKWATVQNGRYYDVLGALEIVVFGKSCRQVDAEMKRRKGFAKDNLVAALNEYAKIKMQHNVEKY